jgi:hypothetical protein
MAEQDWLAERFEEHRAHLRAVAYRTLGSLSEADDAVHQGRALNFVFVDWWAQENELHHHVWFSPQSEPAALRASRPEDPIACAWDLGVIAFEREAWIRHVLDTPGAPGLDAYLADRLDADI